MSADGFPEAPPSAYTRWRRWQLPLAAAIIGWVIVAGLALLALLRVVAWDDLEPLAILNTVTAFVYLPAWVVALVAAVGRRYVLAGAALLVVVAQVALMYPELSAATPAPAWTKGAPSLQLLDGNLYDGNRTMSGYEQQIRDLRPDLVTFEEATVGHVDDLRQSGALASLPYQYQVARYDPWAFFIASRWPLSDTHVVSLSDQPLIVQTTVALPSGSFRLWVVHTIAPKRPTFQLWRDQLALIQRLIRARGLQHLLVVGDFNATWGNRGFRGILDTGLIDGAAARGKALDMTWSQDWGIIPPLVRIDHVLTGTGLAVTQIQTMTGLGSDHRDLLATVARQPSGTG